MNTLFKYIIANNELLKALFIGFIGILGVFIVLFLFYLCIKILGYVKTEKKSLAENSKNKVTKNEKA